MAQEILKFSETDTGTNLLSQAAYTADAQRLIGNQPGIARDKLVNKVLRQSSWVAKVFCDYLVQQTGGNVTDDSNDAVLLAKITSTFATGVPIGSIINHSSSAVPTGFLKCNGAAISRTTYASLFASLVTAPGFALTAFTVTIATPAVVTKTAHGFTGGERLRLSTTGTLPTGLATGTDYFVKYIDANTFNLQTMTDILAGTTVNTSGTQGGVHSYLQSLWGLGDGSTTFNVPDLRGIFMRAWDDSRGIDPSRAVATFQLDMFKAHKHNIDLGNNGAGNDATYASKYSSNANVVVGTAPIYNTGGTETRPMNVAVMPIIKY